MVLIREKGAAIACDSAMQFAGAFTDSERALLGELEVSFLFLNVSPLVPCSMHSLARVICVTNKWMYIFPILMVVQM